MDGSNKIAGAQRAGWSRIEQVSVVAAVLGLYAAAVGIYWLRDLTIPWDAKSQFYNFFRFVGRALAGGEWPLWNPYHFSGFPSVADPQSLLFSPTFLAAAALLPEASISLFDAIVLAHLAFGALAVAALAARRGVRPEAAVLAAIVFFCAGPALGRLQHVGLVVSYAWLPIALLVLDIALDRRSMIAAILFAAVAAVMALGRDQIAFLNCIVLVAFVIAKLAESGEGFRWLGRRLPVLGVMAVTGGALLAVPLVLTLQFAAFSNRPAVAFQIAAYGSLDPFNLVGLFAANFFRGTAEGDLYFGPGSPTWPAFDWTDRSVNFLYVGAAVTALLAWIGPARGVMFGRSALFFTLLAGASLVYALGAHTPLFRPLFETVPGIALYRRPADATFILVFALAMLSGFALDAALHGIRPRRGLATTGMLIAGFVVLAGIALARAPTSGQALAALASLALSIGLAVAGLALLSARLPWAATRWPGIAFVALAALDLGSQTIATPINAEPRRIYAVFDAAPSADQETLETISRALAAEQARGRRPRVEILGPEAGWQNAGMTYGLESTLGYNPLRYALYERATGAAETAHEPRMRPFPKTFRGYRSRLARLLGIEFLVFDQPLERMPAALPRPRLTILRNGPRYWIYQLPPAQPRAMLAARVRRIDTEAALTAGEVPDFDLANEVLVNHDAVIDAVPAATDAPGRPAPGRVAIADYRLNSVRLVAETEAPVVLVLSDLDYPGWTVAVDGERRPLIRANLLFRGVELGPGRHEVIFRFEPFSLENLGNAVTTALSRRQGPH